MIVCICHRVSDRDIAHAVREGCASFDELQHELSVGLGCGACTDCAHDTFCAARASASNPAANPWSSTVRQVEQGFHAAKHAQAPTHHGDTLAVAG
jgi:bacterioferritin-associated ferredoxin